MIRPSGTPTLEAGGLWRDVVNFLGEGEIRPAIYMPLLQEVLPKWGPWTYFLGQAAAKIKRPRDGEAVAADAARAELAWRLWTERREGLRAYAEKMAKRPVDDAELHGWWINDDRGDDRSLWSGGYRETKVTRLFERCLRLGPDEMAIIHRFPDSPVHRDDLWLIAWLNKDLDWLADLERLRTLARKTWPADPRDRVMWTPDDLTFVNGQFEEQAPSLMAPNEDAAAIDPFELTVWNDEQNLGIGLDGLRYCLLVLTRATVIDFADEVIERSRRPSARGSLSCQECGCFVGRRALGYGQLYCSDRCKKRVAKRRYRARSRVAQSGPPTLRVVR